jgi:hypothetical protein
MKKTYISPVAEEIMLKYQYGLLTGSLLDINDEGTIGDDGDIVDTDGVLHPDAREFMMDDEEFE